MTDTDTIRHFHVLCREIVRSHPNDEAWAYARAGLAMTTADEVHTQALYLSCNLTFWRHDNAKACRQALRDIIKALEPTKN